MTLSQGYRWGRHVYFGGDLQSNFMGNPFPPVVSSLFDKVEEFLDKLNGYRHYGDLRYLSDVGEGRFHDVRLLFNPPLIDRVVWMWRRLGKSLFAPIKSHNMNIYRKKLSHIAKRKILTSEFLPGRRLSGDYYRYPVEVLVTTLFPTSDKEDPFTLTPPPQLPTASASW